MMLLESSTLLVLVGHVMTIWQSVVDHQFGLQKEWKCPNKKNKKKKKLRKRTK
jgi:hypothetical protein